jgi:hypothetical protein
MAARDDLPRSRSRSAVAFALCLSTWLGSCPVRGDAPARRPFAEALLTESATDIDAQDAGELQLELNAGRVAARAGGASASFTSLELEWRLLQEVGVRLEPSFARVTGGETAGADDAPGVAGAIALGLWHDRTREVHLQAELLGRTAETASARIFEPGETELPLAADLLAAARRGRWTFRATVGAEAGGSFAHAPLHTDLALLTGLVPDERYGFVAFEVRADWARQEPVVLAPEIVADTSPVGLPLRLGVALPVNIGGDSARPSYGIFVRVQWIIGQD